ncbi:uncharacterized protein [Physcomitrium patens]|uniref:uncharacterized protein isoform X1 n=1 Tax=Physcomitrium patens TaxID=3218 RepID=UPI003CCD9A93
MNYLSGSSSAILSKGFYGVFCGQKTGVYLSSSECEDQVRRYRGSRFYPKKTGCDGSSGHVMRHVKKIAVRFYSSTMTSMQSEPPGDVIGKGPHNSM